MSLADLEETYAMRYLFFTHNTILHLNNAVQGVHADFHLHHL
jgi:hypothetical protein